MRFHFCILFAFATLSAIAQSTASAQVTTFTIDAPQLSTNKKIWLYIPSSYASGKKKYPVIYMHDAQNLFDSKTSYAGEWRLDETLDSLKAQVIIVGIEHGNEKRLEELTPFPNEKYGGGKADNYLEFITKTLKPHIDSVYRTKSNMKNTAIGGSSLGGLVSFYAVLKYPEVFGKALVFSPSFWFSDDIYSLASNKNIKAKMIFLSGDNESDDMVTDLNKMYNLVAKNHHSPRRNLTKTIVAGGKHNEKLWRDSFAKAYLWMF